MTKISPGGRVVVASEETGQRLRWQLHHPNRRMYLVTFHKEDQTWSVDLFDIKLMNHSKRPPTTLLSDCGISKLVGKKTPKEPQ